jgi:hypothetical protein
MRIRTLVIEMDDPTHPGLLIRRYARVHVCWEATLGDWGWFLLSAAGDPFGRVQGPFPSGDAAFEDAAEQLGGGYEGVTEV